MGEVEQDRLEDFKAIERVLAQASVLELLDGPMEKAEVIVEGIDELEEDAAVLLLEQGLLSVVLLVCNGLLLFFYRLLWPK